MARNFKSSVVKGRRVATPVAFVVGVAMNAGVIEALREAFGLQQSDCLVPDLNCWMPALGGSIGALEASAQCAAVGFRKVQSEAAAVEQIPTNDPLSLDNVTLLRNTAPTTAPPQGESCTDAYLGIDVGSVSTNFVVLDAGGRLLKEIYVPTSGRPIEVTAGLREIEEELGSHVHIRGVGTTGSGRELIGELTGADTMNDDITAHTTGALHVCRQLGMPLVDTIFDIGGQDSKFIRIRNGAVVDFTMNEACAAGTGSFLEEQAEKLGVTDLRGRNSGSVVTRPSEIACQPAGDRVPRNPWMNSRIVAAFVSSKHCISTLPLGSITAAEMLA